MNQFLDKSEPKPTFQESEKEIDDHQSGNGSKRRKIISEDGLEGKIEDENGKEEETETGSCQTREEFLQKARPYLQNGPYVYELFSVLVHR